MSKRLIDEVLVILWPKVSADNGLDDKFTDNNKDKINVIDIAVLCI